MKTYFGLAFLLLAAAPAHGLYFDVVESETRCFIEEVPDETLVVGKYKTQAQNPDGSYAPSSPGTGIHVEVHDPQDGLIMSKDYEAEGRFSFISHEPGEHVICIHTNSTRWFGGRTLVSAGVVLGADNGQRVHLDIKVGEGANDYEVISKKEQLSTVETRLYQLLSQTKQILNEQAYQRTREATFREVSESTNARVLWWSLCQALVLCLTAWWQVQHLKGFFEAKKLV